MVEGYQYSWLMKTGSLMRGALAVNLFRNIGGKHAQSPLDGLLDDPPKLKAGRVVERVGGVGVRSVPISFIERGDIGSAPTAEALCDGEK